MKKIKNSVLLCNNLYKLWKKLEYLWSEIDIETRWNSIYYMLCKFQRMEIALKMLIIKHISISDLMSDSITWIRIKICN